MRQLSRLCLLALVFSLLVLPAQALLLLPEENPPAAPTEPVVPNEPETPSEPETPAQPETPSEPEDPAESVILTGLFTHSNKIHWPYLDLLLVVEEGEPLDLSRLPQEGLYLDPSGKTYEIPLQWDTLDPALQTPGYHTIAAAPILPEHMSLAEGFDGVITWPVFRKGDGALLEVSPLQDHYISDNMISLGSTDPLSEVSISTKGRRWAVGETGYILSTPEWVWEWDTSRIDTSKPGQTSVTGTLVSLPDWISVPQAARTVTHPVYVLPTDGIDLSAPNLGMIQNAIQFQWLYDCSAVTEALLEYQKDGAWIPCEDAWYRYSSPTFVSGAKLLLYPLKMPPGNYTLRLRYTDETSGQPAERFTDTLTITVPDNAAELMAGTPKPEDFGLGGDRDGGDSGGTALPDVQQPAPEGGSSNETSRPSHRPSAKPKPVTPMEVVTDTSTTISGLRLNQLVSLGSTVLFEKQGAALEIPSQFLTGLNLAENASLTVSITQPETGAVQIQVTAAGQPIQALPGASLRVPFALSENESLICRSLSEEEISAVTYEPATGIAHVSIQQTGTYLFSAEAKKSPASTEEDRIPDQNQPPVSEDTEETTTTPDKTGGSETPASPSDQIKSPLVSDGEPVLTNRPEPPPSEDRYPLPEESPSSDLSDAVTLWDDQTPTALALLAATILLLAAGLLLRRWRDG